MFQRLLLVASFLFTVNAWSSNASSDLMDAICEEVSNNYNAETHNSEAPLSRYGVVINKNDCPLFDLKISSETYEQIGSEKNLTEIEAQFESDHISCHVLASRSVNKVDALNKSQVVLGPWEAWLEDSLDPGCVIRGSSEIESFDFKSSFSTLQVAESKNLPKYFFIPAPAQLGETENSQNKSAFKIFELRQHSNLKGYLVEYWYADSNGPWSTQHILKYNSSGQLLGHLIENNRHQYCDFPWSPQSPPECTTKN